VASIFVTVEIWYNKPLASATLVAVPPGDKNAELDPNPKKKNSGDTSKLQAIQGPFPLTL
jgi:hypothetical protein